jgi:hypothetical protein
VFILVGEHRRIRSFFFPIHNIRLYLQAYNAQAVVDTEGSQLVLGTDVIRTPSDANQLEPAVQSIDPSIGVVRRALADGGYANADSFDTLEQQGVELYVAITREDHNERRYDFRPPSSRPFKKVTDPRLVAMRVKLAQKDGKRIYARRASTVEPVFGIIKAAMGFRQFLLRGMEKVHIEWDLVCLAYNVKRLWGLSRA